MISLSELIQKHSSDVAADIIARRKAGEGWKDIAAVHGIHRVTAIRIAQRYLMLQNATPCYTTPAPDHGKIPLGK